MERILSGWASVFQSSSCRMTGTMTGHMLCMLDRQLEHTSLRQELQTAQRFCLKALLPASL